MIVSLAVLVKAAGYFTEYSEKAGLALGVSQFIIGATLVSVGTSLPELLTATFAAIKGATEIVSADVIGSNITNILLVVGMAALFSKNTLYNKRLDENLDIPILACITVLLFLTVRDGVFTFSEAILMVAAYIIYTIYLFYTHKQEKELEKEIKEDVKDLKKTMGPKKLQWHIPVVIVISAIFLFIGAHFTVESIVEVAGILNIGTAVIAGSAIAIGTSLPELAVGIQAARKKQAAMVLGNIFGSNIFNGTMAIGVPGLITTITVPDVMTSVGVTFLIAATVLLLISSLSKHISLYEGGLYIAIYFYFLKELITFK